MAHFSRTRSSTVTQDDGTAIASLAPSSTAVSRYFSKSTLTVASLTSPGTARAVPFFLGKITSPQRLVRSIHSFNLSRAPPPPSIPHVLPQPS